MIKENDLLEKTLELAENGYEEAYRFLFKAYDENPGSCGPQTLYFLACLAGGSGLSEEAMGWLQKSICDHGWWYRPEVLEDDDLAELRENAAFISLKEESDSRYHEAAVGSKAVFSWGKKTADRILLAVHGNTQNGKTAREDWQPFLKEHPRWQLETIQSAEPDGYGTYRWSYDMESYVPVATAIAGVQQEAYQEIVCGGFSAGCDMLLRAVTFSAVRCDALILQSPWIPVLQDHAEEVTTAIREKQIKLIIRCGSEDEDCLPMAEQLKEAADAAGVPATLTIQKGCRHQFPAEE